MATKSKNGRESSHFEVKLRFIAIEPGFFFTGLAGPLRGGEISLLVNDTVIVEWTRHCFQKSTKFARARSVCVSLPIMV